MYVRVRHVDKSTGRHFRKRESRATPVMLCDQYQCASRPLDHHKPDGSENKGKKSDMKAITHTCTSGRGKCELLNKCY